MIYAIRVGADGPIKIGRATNPVQRLMELQTAHHQKLNLIAVARWQDEMERELHDILKYSRLEGEWFKPNEHVLWIVEKMRDHDAAHEIMFAFHFDHHFPWMDAEAEPLALEYMDELYKRCVAPLNIVGGHTKWKP